jgi:hypothetical protein
MEGLPVRAALLFLSDDIEPKFHLLVARGVVFFGAERHPLEATTTLLDAEADFRSVMERFPSC